jgi:ribosome-associated heat shock protein Hsp15
MSESTRIDKWLWAARFFNSRSQASAAVEGGKIHVNGQRVKPAKDVKAGDEVDIHVGRSRWSVIVCAIGERRGPAAEAQKLYEETADSVARREREREARRLKVEPSLGLHGRPTKRDRRRLDKLGRG